MTQPDQLCIQQTWKWIDSFIIKYDLCPFAKQEMDKGSVKIVCSRATTIEAGIADVKSEIEFLDTHMQTETSFIVFPSLLQDFFDYLDFTWLTESELQAAGYEGIYQLATFHPDYCFADADVDDVTNYTNRSPYPMLHILREESVEKAVTWFGNTGIIPENNMTRLRLMGREKVEDILNTCLMGEQDVPCG